MPAGVAPAAVESPDRPFALTADIDLEHLTGGHGEGGAHTAAEAPIVATAALGPVEVDADRGHALGHRPPLGEAGVDEAL